MSLTCWSGGGPGSVNFHAAKTHLPRLAEEAHASAESILAKAGKPYAKPVPLDAPVPTRVLRPLGLLRTNLASEEIEESVRPLDEEALELWE